MIEPMSYVLLFPDGQPGWGVDYKDEKGNNIVMKDINGHKVTLMQYLSYIQYPRKNEQFNPIVNARKLYQQWSIIL